MIANIRMESLDISPRSKAVVKRVLSSTQPLSTSAVQVFNLLRDTARQDPIFCSFNEVPKDLSRFARRGGPGLELFDDWAMNIKRERERSSSPPSKKRAKTLIANISTHDVLFRELVEKQGFVYPNPRAPKPTNLYDLREIAKKRRSSVDNANFSEEWVEDFVTKMKDMIDENQFMQDALPHILGPAPIYHLRDHIFTGLDRICKDVVRPKPDHYEGLKPSEISKSVRQELKRFIIPCANPKAPCLPNFFLEAKGPGGLLWVAVNQAILGGAAGAQAVRELQQFIYESSLSRELLNPSTDLRAYTICATVDCNSCMLNIYCVHITQGHDGSRSFVMTVVGAWYLGSHFIEAVTAIRNLREWAEEQRQTFAKQASA